MKRVIVFGGTGWLGHNIVLELRRQGAEVTIATRGKKAAFLEEVAGIPQVTVDKTDEAAMKDLFAHAHWDAVIDSVPTSASLALVVKYAVGIDHYVHCSSTGGYAPLPFIPATRPPPTSASTSARAGPKRPSSTPRRSTTSTAQASPPPSSAPATSLAQGSSPSTTSADAAPSSCPA